MEIRSGVEFITKDHEIFPMLCGYKPALTQFRDPGRKENEKQVKSRA